MDSTGHDKLIEKSLWDVIAFHLGWQNCYHYADKTIFCCVLLQYWKAKIWHRGLPIYRGLFSPNISRETPIALWHYCDVIMNTVASQITSLTIVYLTVNSDIDQRKHQSSASLAFVRRIHRRPVNSPHKGPVTRKMFPFDDVIMGCLSWDPSVAEVLPSNLVYCGGIMLYGTSIYRESILNFNQGTVSV